MEISVLLDRVENAFNRQEFDKAAAVLWEIEKVYKENLFMADKRYAILKTAVLYSDDSSEEAEEIIQKGLLAYPDNYELYFNRGEYLERHNEPEKACANFYFAFYLGKDSQDRGYLAEVLLQNKSQKNLNVHKMNLAITQIVEERMKLNSLQDAYSFLRWLFYEMSDKSKAPYLSEETMLLFIMLESAMTEKNIWTEKAFEEFNTCVLFGNSYQIFKKPYIETKHAIWRSWFGMSAEENEYIAEVIEKYHLSMEAVAVMAKFCIPQAYWVEGFERLYRTLQKVHNDTAPQFEKFVRAIPSMTQVTQKDSIRKSPKKNNMTLERIYLDRETVCPDQKFLDQQQKDETGIAVIFCTNDELMEQECFRYLQLLEIPKGYHAHVYAIWNARGICYGYNRAMKRINARYKVYIHHDCLLIQPDILIQLTELLKNDWKMLGVAGSLSMKDEFWWKFDDYRNVRYNIFQDRCLETILSKTIEYNDKVDEAAAIDGILIATSKDLIWREDIFDEWHFYDISQCFEFRKKGFKIGLVNDENPWLIHETTTKRDPDNRYEHYGKIFRKMYLE